jgi:hypothetical protein
MSSHQNENPSDCHSSSASQRNVYCHELKLHVRMDGRYRVLDLAGGLEFHVVFGILWRGHSEFNLSKLLIDTSGSIFDVPYALTHNLLNLYDGRANQGGQVIDLSSFDWPASERNVITIHARPTGHKLYTYDEYVCKLGIESPLVKLFHAGNQYSIEPPLASRDLGIKWWSYGDYDFPGDKSELPNVRRTNRSGVGWANFLVAQHVVLPPPVKVRLQLRDGKLEFKVTNCGSEVILIQSEGYQHYWRQYGPFQQEVWEDNRPRLNNSSLIVTSAETNQVVQRFKHPVSIQLGGSPKSRPKRKQLMILEPNRPIMVDTDEFGAVGGLLKMKKKPDGIYRIEVETLGVWWTKADLEQLYGKEKSAIAEDDEITEEAFKAFCPSSALRLKCEDVVELRVTGGKLEPVT